MPSLLGRVRVVAVSFPPPPHLHPSLSLPTRTPQSVLSEDLFSAMVTKVAVNIAKNLETLLLRKQFTQLGSVQVRVATCVVEGWLPCPALRVGASPVILPLQARACEQSESASLGHPSLTQFAVFPAPTPLHARISRTAV